MNIECENKQQFIESLSVYELRGLARALGIKSPTTKIREKLIEEIVGTLRTGEVPQPRDNNKGRPSKELANIKVILDMLTGKNESHSTYDKLAVFNQDTPVFTTKSDRLDKMSGVARIAGSVVYFQDLRSPSKVFIGENLAKDVNICSGDLLEVEAYKISLNQYYAKNILSLNFMPVDKYKQCSRLSLERVLPSQFMGYNDGCILIGGRNVVELENPLFISNTFKSILDYINKQPACNIFVGFNMCYEDKYYINSYQNLVSITTDYESECKCASEKLIDTINLISNLNALGKSVNLIVYDFATVVAELDKCYQAKQTPSQESLILVKKLISLAGAYNQNVNTTLIATYCDQDKNNETIKQELLKISNNILKM